VTALDAFLLILFEKYAELLKRRFSDDFQEVSSSPYLMPDLIDKFYLDRVHGRLYAHAN
jgi:hypothetical protein